MTNITTLITRMYQSRWFWLIVIVGALCVKFHPSNMSVVSLDCKGCLYPWVDYIQSHGYWQALAEPFHNYSPLYIYWLVIVAMFHGVEPVYLIKGFSIAFELLMAYYAGRLATTAAPRRGKWIAWGTAATILWLPTVMNNTLGFGQCDSVYTAFALGSLLYFMRGRMLLGVVMFAISLSFKQQAIFIFPILYFLAVRGQLPWRYMLIIPVVYCATLLPAWIVGRDMGAMLLTYAQQRECYPWLTLNCPNLYVPTQYLLSALNALHTMWIIRDIAMVIVACASLWIFWRLGKTKRLILNPMALLYIATLCAMIYPFVLPGMHERYLFMAEALAVAIMFARPVLCRAFVWIPIVSMGAYVCMYWFPTNVPLLFFMALWIVAIVMALRYFRRDFIDHGQGGHHNTSYIRTTRQNC